MAHTHTQTFGFIRKKVIIIVVVILVVLGAAAFVFRTPITDWVNATFHLGTTEEQKTDDSSVSKPAPLDDAAAARIEDVAALVSSPENQGNTTKQAEIYAEAASTSSGAEKAYYQATQATVYVTAGDLQQALTVALLAHQESPSAFTASVVADIYERLGDKAKALEYYKQAVTYSEAAGRAGLGDFYRYKVEELK